MIKIKVSEQIKDLCPDFIGIGIMANVANSQYNDTLWKLISNSSISCTEKYKLEEIKNNPAISATRRAYKMLGKDPNRYRPSAEALYRRLIRGISLYQIDTLVDIINLISIETGYSINGFDCDKIDGNSLVMSIGEADELYEGIGKGLLNIQGLPVYRDSQGGIGTPTSDNERTKLDLGTTRLLTVINSYEKDKKTLEQATDRMKFLLREFASADQFKEITF